MSTRVTYMVAYFGAVLVALGVTPLVIRIARSMRLVDRPGLRRVHSVAMPRIGGVAVAVAVFVVVIPTLAIAHRTVPAIREFGTEIVAVLATSFCILLVGLIDDMFGVRARLKLLAQIAAAIVVCSFGISIDRVGVAGVFVLELGYWSWPLTILWIVGLTNAVNLIDGLDGLAAGISAIACGVIAVFAISSGLLVMGILMLAVLGSLTGFLVFNFSPARIFLGDCGSMFLGFFLASASVAFSAKSHALAGLAITALVLGVPIFDTVSTMIRRFLARRSIFGADREHIHHRLIDMGLHHRQVVIIMYVITVLAGGTGLFLMIARRTWTAVVFFGALLPVLVVFRLAGGVRLREACAAFQRKWTMARQTKEQLKDFEEIQLHLREARTFEESWRAIRRSARKLGFSRVTIEFDGPDGTTCSFAWRRVLSLGGASLMHVTIPRIQSGTGPSFRAEIEVPVTGSLELVGRRVALFGRLLDEHDPLGPDQDPDLPDESRTSA